MTSWLTRFTAPGDTARMGPLEWRVLEALWTHGEPGSVRDLHPSFEGVAYTTLMTTMDRLFQKGVLSRVKRGRAFVYQPQVGRLGFKVSMADAAVRAALEAGANASELDQLISCLVDALNGHDPVLLDRLEALIRARRAEINDAVG